MCKFVFPRYNEEGRIVNKSNNQKNSNKQAIVNLRKVEEICLS